MTVAQARAEIELFAQTAAFPALVASDVDACLRAARRASQPFAAGVLTGTPVLNEAPTVKPGVVPPDDFVEWAATTAYALGARVTPVERNGHYYKVTVAGTSGATQPVFPTTSGGTVVDGTVTWQEAGEARWVPTFNLASGVVSALRIKLAKLATAYDFRSDDQSFSRSQMTKHLGDLVRMWQARMNESLVLQGSGQSQGNLNALPNFSRDDDRWCECYNSYGCGECRGWAIPGQVLYIED